MRWQHTRKKNLGGFIPHIKSIFATLIFPLSVFPVFRLTASLSKDVKANNKLRTPLVSCILQPADGAIMYRLDRRSDRSFRYN